MNIECKEAPEPSNIEWVNLRKTFIEQLKSKIGVFITMVLVLLLAFYLFTLLKEFGVKQKIRYPKIDCNNFNSYNEDEFKNIAGMDKESTLRGKGLGVYQCYCNNNLDLVGYSFGKYKESNLCYVYMQDRYDENFYSGLTSLSVVVINIIIRTVGTKLINKIGLHQGDEITMNIMTIIYIGQYINTGILLVVASANFEHTPLSFINIRNSYTDYENSWYLVVGKQLQNTMIIQAFVPFINLFLLYGKKFFFRFLDSRCTMFQESPDSRKKTKEQFISLYGGPDVVIQYRYSSSLVDVWVAFTYGLAIPALFPIVLMSLVNMYVIEKLLFAYFYKQPPLFDNKMNARVIKIMKMAPIAMLLNGYWLLGNRQMFFDEHFEQESQAGVLNPKHYLFDLAGVSGGFMLLVFVPFFCFISYYEKLLMMLYRKMFRKVKDPGQTDYTDFIDENFEFIQGCAIDENLPNYFRVL